MNLRIFYNLNKEKFIGLHHWGFVHVADLKQPSLIKFLCTRR